MPDISVLIIDDEPSILKAVSMTLKQEHIAVTCADNGALALDILKANTFDLILLDIIMPDQDGFSILKVIRSSQNYTPVILLSGRGEDSAQVKGLELGADDYITKPFGMMELVSRVKAVLRRSNRNEKKDEIVIGQLKIYPNKHKVKSCGNEVTLTNKEFKLLCLLVESKGNVLNRDQLLTNIWGYDFDGETRTVDVHIRSLRQKLGECGKLIETVRGIGYRIGGNES